MTPYVRYNDRVHVYGNIGDGCYLTPSIPFLNWSPMKKNTNYEWRISRANSHVADNSMFFNDDDMLIFTKNIQNPDALRFGDIIYLESIQHPGQYIACSGDGVPGRMLEL